jgi:mannitol-1-phosphate/altronate dehydrogenase
MLQKFGIDQVTDELLLQEITLNVNVGMGATDPSQKLQKFLTAITSYSNILQKPAPGLNAVEVGKEIFGHLGYADGSRFFTVSDPQVLQLQQELQKAQGLIQQLEGKVKEKDTKEQVGLQKTRETNQTKLVAVKMHEEAENKRAVATHWAALTMHAHPQPPAKSPKKSK